MIPSDKGIREALRSGALEIEPAPAPDPYATCAVDLILGPHFHCWDREKSRVPGVRVELNLAEQEFKRTAESYLQPAPCGNDGSLVLPPYSTFPQHRLGITRDRVHLKRSSRLAARVEGRSSLARLGLVVGLTAPAIHAGFNAPIVLEMINFGPFHRRLVPHRTRIRQIIFESLESEPDIEIATGFQSQETAEG